MYYYTALENTRRVLKENVSLVYAGYVFGKDPYKKKSIIQNVEYNIEFRKRVYILKITNNCSP